MHNSTQKGKRTCRICGTVLEQGAPRRSLVDVVGASLLSLLVLGLAVLFADIFGFGGGRHALTAIIGITGFVIWGLWHIVGSTEHSSCSCPSCGLQESDSRAP